MCELCTEMMRLSPAAGDPPLGDQELQELNALALAVQVIPGGHVAAVFAVESHHAQ